MDSALIFAYVLDGTGGGQPVGANDITNWSAEHGTLWVHLDYKEQPSHRWLSDESGVEPVVVEALLADDTRPRCFSYASGVLVILRGVNLNPGADPEDMISIRLWIEKSRIISIRHRKVLAVEVTKNNLNRGEGPVDSGSFMVELTKCMAHQIGDVLNTVDDEVDALEDEVIDQGSFEQRGKLSSLRRQIIRLRRYLAPQREVMTRLQTEKASFLTEMDRIHLRETADKITRYVEDLDSAKDRAAVCQEELESRMGAQMNKTLYILSIITAIFLPLGLITGLLGINVGGIPGSENPFAFIFVCLMMLVIAIGQIIIFRKKSWV